jgi:hypothetical protein
MITATATISTTISSTENHNYAVPLLNLEDYRSDIWNWNRCGLVLLVRTAERKTGGPYLERVGGQEME